jgi:predicted Fe-Mo cluster-binding NifX family protein
VGDPKPHRHKLFHETGSLEDSWDTREDPKWHADCFGLRHRGKLGVMKIAVALFGKRVSPNFSTAPELLILIAQEGNTPCSWRAQMEGMSSRQRVLRLASMGVDIVVCGGIDRSTRTELERRGIRVVSDVQGDPMDVVGGLMSRGS